VVIRKSRDGLLKLIAPAFEQRFLRRAEVIGLDEMAGRFDCFFGVRFRPVTIAPIASLITRPRDID